ncbi:hypothetical protein AXG93_1927s1030 [Marchantia polymorpha subsp. ruderalis]|uniref:Uncharacterized protein n=1 Tax=Marchantia polymorpha subsp. ruderalis TaxID=1480154 RepID=A0A176W3E8_MARPO|nr:hypothetical protein AXG93_1927s1030 [Marchantia polymorpha subsp. ruderalis]
MTSKDVDMGENDIYDVDYDELALGPSKRRRRGSGSFNLSFTTCATTTTTEPEDVLQCPSPGCCPCNSDSVMGDKSSKSTCTLRFQCRVPGVKLRDPQGSMDKSIGRALSLCHRYGAEIQLGSAYDGASATEEVTGVTYIPTEPMEVIVPVGVIICRHRFNAYDSLQALSVIYLPSLVLPSPMNPMDPFSF